MIYGLVALSVGLMFLFFGMKISALENELNDLKIREDRHYQELGEDMYRSETWKAAANFRFDDDEKDIGELKAQCERFKGYIYRQTGEKI